MGTKLNPGEFDCLEKLQPNEPFFILRGQDRSAAKCVRDWAARAQAEGVNPAKVAEAWHVADEMDRYAIERGKEPD
jgi:hypothetical protein